MSPARSLRSHRAPSSPAPAINSEAVSETTIESVLLEWASHRSDHERRRNVKPAKRLNILVGCLRSGHRKLKRLVPTKDTAENAISVRRAGCLNQTSKRTAASLKHAAAVIE